jgi:hypothetical protein
MLHPRIDSYEDFVEAAYVARVEVVFYQASGTSANEVLGSLPTGGFLRLGTSALISQLQNDFEHLVKYNALTTG